MYSRYPINVQWNSQWITFKKLWSYFRTYCPMPQNSSVEYVQVGRKPVLKFRPDMF